MRDAVPARDGEKAGGCRSLLQNGAQLAVDLACAASDARGWKCLCCV